MTLEYMPFQKMVRCLCPSLALARQSHIIHLSMVSWAYIDPNFVFDGFEGLPCDINGKFLPEGSLPPPWDHPPPTDWSPFENRTSFELADLLFCREQMSASNIDDLLQIWASTLPSDRDPPFNNKQDMYNTLDAINEGDAPWQSFSVSFSGEIPEGDTTSWMHAKYDVHFRDPHIVLHNQLGNPDFTNEIDFAAKEVHDENNKCHYQDFMSGDWAWRQSVCSCENVIL